MSDRLFKIGDMARFIRDCTGELPKRFFCRKCEIVSFQGKEDMIYLYGVKFKGSNKIYFLFEDEIRRITK